MFALHLQVNLYLKRVNSNKPSEDRILWTATSLNFGLPILQSIRNMQISKKDNEKSYQRHTQQDSKVLSDFIVNKINFLPKHLSKKQVYNPYFWENDTRVLIVANSPSSRLNQHYTDANEYVEKHYNAIVEDFSLFADQNVENEVDHDDETFEEDDF